MTAKRGRRIGIGILLIFAGVANVAALGENPPVGGVETTTFYVIAGGLWLIFRKGSRPTDA